MNLYHIFGVAGYQRLSIELFADYFILILGSVQCFVGLLDLLAAVTDNGGYCL